MWEGGGHFGTPLYQNRYFLTPEPKSVFLTPELKSGFFYPYTKKITPMLFVLVKTTPVPFCLILRLIYHFLLILPHTVFCQKLPSLYSFCPILPLCTFLETPCAKIRIFLPPLYHAKSGYF